MNVLVLVAPGQGAQTPGFLSPWLDLPGAADRLAGWSDTVGLDLVHYGTKADADEIRDTKVAQPLLVAAGLLSAGELGLFGNGGTGRPDAVAGHSVGEITAAVLAGVLSEQDALSFVATRGRAMAEAAAVTETGMSAVLGGDQDTVLAHLTGLDLTPANINGAGQIVAAGTLEQLGVLAEQRPEGSRVRPLAVAGAFHTAHMAPAVAALEALAPNLTVADPSLPYVSNADGQKVDKGAEVVRRLVTQVSHPVRWDLCMETFKQLGVTAIIEVSPGGTLVGLAKRALPGVRTLALKTPEHLAAARELAAETAGNPPQGAPADSIPQDATEEHPQR